jgi:hypothetical protein
MMAEEESRERRSHNFHTAHFMSFRSVSASTPCRSVITFSKLPWRYAREVAVCE